MEHEAEGDPNLLSKDLPEIPTPYEPRTITPSLQTLEKAVAARIYFENIYFAILRKPPSREQRRQAMERELALMRISEEAKDEIRERWLQNESDYLRERRNRVDPSSFKKLKTIGHGEFQILYATVN
jgi:protein-serine/threonine kinase